MLTRITRPIVPAILLAATLLITPSAHAQSGHAVFNGYVAFDGLAYNDKQPTAKIELLPAADPTHVSASADTTEHGLYTISPAPCGEFTLRISAPGYTTYQIPIYLPSDFTGNLAVMLKKTPPPP